VFSFETLPGTNLLCEQDTATGSQPVAALDLSTRINRHAFHCLEKHSSAVCTAVPVSSASKVGQTAGALWADAADW
jgi:hypothetical protein